MPVTGTDLLLVTAAWPFALIAVGLALDVFKVRRNARRGTLHRYVNMKFCLALTLVILGSCRLTAHVLDRYGDAPTAAAGLILATVPAVFSAGLGLAVVLGMAGFAVLGLNLSSVALLIAGTERFYFLGWSEIVHLTTGAPSFWLALVCFLVSTVSGFGGILYLLRKESMAEYTGLRPFQRGVWRVLAATWGRLLRRVGRAALPVRGRTGPDLHSPDPPTGRPEEEGPPRGL